MAQETIGGKIPLTESQARALAFWWSGRYHRLKPEHKGEESLHGVNILMTQVSEAASIYFLEDANCLENQRNSINPGAPDWLG